MLYGKYKWNRFTSKNRLILYVSTSGLRTAHICISVRFISYQNCISELLKVWGEYDFLFKEIDALLGM